jgi:hypothetical protein
LHFLKLSINIALQQWKQRTTQKMGRNRKAKRVGENLKHKLNEKSKILIDDGPCWTTSNFNK